MERATWKSAAVGVLGVLGVVAWAGSAVADNYGLATRNPGDYDEAVNVHGFAGLKGLDGNDWEGIDSLYTVGADIDYATGPVAVVAALFHSRASGDSGGVDVNAQFTEAQLGLRKIWYRYAGLRPYAGGGGTAVWMSISDSRIDSDQRYTKMGFGVWAGGGAYLAIHDAWNVGVDLRGSYVPISIRGEDRNAGGWQAGLVIGYHGQVW